MRIDYTDPVLSCRIHHNISVMKQAETTINSMLELPKSGIWFTDEKGNKWIPKGKIQINFYQGF